MTPQDPRGPGSGRVIVGVDGSPDAAKALAWAVDKAALPGPVSPVVAYHPPSSPFAALTGPSRMPDPEIYRQAAEALIADGLVTAADFPDFASESGFRKPQTEFIDGVTFDGTQPNAYLEQFPVGLKGQDKI